MLSESNQFCTFHLGDLFFGVEVEMVQEVIRYQDMTPVPLASRVIRGLINLRGQIVTAIDMRRRFEMPDLPDGELPMNVVVRTEEGALSLLVDEIGDVLELDEDYFEAPPATLTGIARELVRGVYKLDGHLLLLLDTHAAIDVGNDAVTQDEAA